MRSFRPVGGPNEHLHWEYEGGYEKMFKDLRESFGPEADDETRQRLLDHLDNPRSDLRLFLEQTSTRARDLMGGALEIPMDSWEVATALAEREAAGRPVDQQRIQDIYVSLYGINFPKRPDSDN